MRHFIEHRGLSPVNRNLSAEEATTRIMSKLTRLIRSNPPSLLNLEQVQFWTEKLVLDILDYCHRRDFPEALVYVCVELIKKRLDDLEEAAGDSEEDTSTLPLSRIKMDDTEFEFDTDLIIKTTAPDNIGLLSDLDFNSIKPRLNLYRRVVTL